MNAIATPVMIASVAAALCLGGCGRTLVFGEHDGVNLAIRANSTATPPIEVNFGLDRAIATIVPPTGEQSSRPSGDAVNMFAGFQVERFGDLAPNKPVGVDLQITTQFASGAAAKAVAGDPGVVAQIVTLSGITVQRSAAFADTIGSRSALVERVHRLNDSQLVAVATEMAPRLSERTDPSVRQLDGAIPRNRPFTPANAKQFLLRWASMETLTPVFAAEWTRALANVGQ